MPNTPNVIEGQTISKWTEQWWTWAANLPDDANPFTHPDGSFTSVDNNRPVFFIAGISQVDPSTGQPAPFDVPFGTPLLVPLINAVDTAPEYLHNPNKNDFLATSQAIHATENANIHYLDSIATGLFVELDKMPLTYNKVESSFFSMGILQAGTLAVDYFHLIPTAPVDFTGIEMTPSKSGGYWVMIDNLSLGTHTLHFGGLFGDVGTPLDVTDIINVVGTAPAHDAMLI